MSIAYKDPLKEKVKEIAFGNQDLRQ